MQMYQLIGCKHPVRSLLSKSDQTHRLSANGGYESVLGMLCLVITLRPPLRYQIGGLQLGLCRLDSNVARGTWTGSNLPY